MSFIPIGSPSGNNLYFEIPADGTTNWGQQLRTLFFNRLNTHNHDGVGGGAQIGNGSLENNSVSTAKLQDSAITLAKMAINSVSNTQIVDGSVSTTKVADDAIDDTKIRLRNNQWLTARNAANDADVNIVRVNASNVIELAADVAPGDNTISTAKLQDNAVTTAKIGDNQITNAKMADNAINTAELVDGAVTLAKMDVASVSDQNIVKNIGSSSLLTWSTTTEGTWTKVGTVTINHGYSRTNYGIELSLEIQTGSFRPGLASTDGIISVLRSTSSATSVLAEIMITEDAFFPGDGRVVGFFPITFNIGTSTTKSISVPANLIRCIDTYTTGVATSHTYAIQARLVNGSAAAFSSVVLIARTVK